MIRQPNILLIFSDQHAQRVAGCYGDPIAETPHLDRLAANGVTFDNAYCPSPICVPSRMSMLTGRYPGDQKCWTLQDYLPSDYPTWAHAVGAAGYRPTLISRLHSVGPDQLHGFRAQLARDPDELDNLAQIPEYGAVRDALLAKVLHAWDPDLIRRETQIRRLEKDLLTQWGAATQPASSYDNPIVAADSWLDRV